MPEEKTKHTSKSPLLPLAGLVAGVVSAFLIGLLVWQFDTPSTERLFRRHYAPIASFQIPATPTEAALLDQTKFLYETGNFEAVISKLEQIPDSFSVYPLSQIYLGIAYLELEQTDQAIRVFEAAIAQRDPLYTIPTRWYLALAQLKQGNTSACQEQLQILVDQQAKEYAGEASSLLQDLEN